MVIGLYGKSGSGKTTACEYFLKNGFFIINADKIGHEILKKGNKALSLVTKEFGIDYIDCSGELDRKKLGKLVFSDKNELEKLNKITKPIIEEKIINLINKHENTVVDGAILNNTKIIDYCDVTILIRSENSQNRIIKRDALSEKEAENRLNSQIISENADIIIDNNGTIEEFYEKLKQALKHGGSYGKKAFI